jgi:ABC-type branched-subunit amino acid transport system permease subunit
VILLIVVLASGIALAEDDLRPGALRDRRTTRLAARFSGIPVDRYKLDRSTPSPGFMAGLAGCMLRLPGQRPPARTWGPAWELDAIAAVVLGGTSIFGGRRHDARHGAGRDR